MLDRICDLDETGNPKFVERSVALEDGSVFAGWWLAQRSERPFVLGIHHRLGHRLYSADILLAIPLSAPVVMPPFYSLSGRIPRPGEAGPVMILQTADFIYLHYEPNKPVFHRFDETSGLHEACDRALVGVHVRPIVPVSPRPA